MPIHTSWKSMCKGILANAKYCKRNPERKCHSFTDGSKVCGCQGGWSVFYATVAKRVGKGGETKPMPKKFSESREKLIEWFMESTLKSSDVGHIPKWVGLAQKVIKSPKFTEKVKNYWKGRLKKWCKENPDQKICKSLKFSESYEEKTVRKMIENGLFDEILRGVTK